MDEQEIKQIAAEQAEDEGLWFIAETASEAYLQQELRRLHEAIEDKTWEECAVEAIEHAKRKKPRTEPGR